MFVLTATLWLLAVAFGSATVVTSPCTDSHLSPPDQKVAHRPLDPRVPLFELVVKPHTGNTTRAGVAEYNVELFAKNRLLGFTGAEIAVISTGECGVGEFHYDSANFRLEKSPSCPALVFDKSSKSIHELPALRWTPPSCGCVQFRAVVVEAGSISYTDPEDVSNGQLTTTVCVHKQSRRESHIESLCQSYSLYSSPEILARTSFLGRHGLDIKWMDRVGVESSLDVRRLAVGACCEKKTEEKRSRCLERIRFHRVDAFCQNGYPDIPFTSLRLKHMLDREKTCCFILGSHRYSCFKQGSKLVPGTAGDSTLDYSLDETDAVNDLADFATPQDVHNLGSLIRLEFGANLDPSPKKVSGAWIRVKGHRIQRNRSDKEFEDDFEEEKDYQSTRDTNGGRSLDGSMRSTAIFPVSTAVETTNPLVSNSANVDSDFSTSVPAKKPKRRLGSAQRRRRGRGRQGGKRAGRRRGSQEAKEAAMRRRVAPRRRQMPKREDPVDPDLVDPPLVMDEAENELGQAGSSSTVDDELIEIDRGIDILRIKRSCCIAGSKIKVKSLGHFWAQLEICEVEAEQFADELNHGRNACFRKFRRCCISATVSDPMTSSEYDDKLDMRSSPRQPFGRDKESFQRTVEPSGVIVDDQRVRQELPAGEGPVFNPAQGRDLQDQFDRESEIRYQSMRASEPVADDDDEEEKDGPARFDEVDNTEKAGLGLAVRKREEEKQKEQPKSDTEILQAAIREGGKSNREPADEEVDDHDDRDFVDGHEDDEDDGEDEVDEDENGEPHKGGHKDGKRMISTTDGELSRSVAAREESLKQYRIRNSPRQTVGARAPIRRVPVRRREFLPSRTSAQRKIGSVRRSYTSQGGKSRRGRGGNSRARKGRNSRGSKRRNSRGSKRRTSRRRSSRKLRNSRRRSSRQRASRARVTSRELVRQYRMLLPRGPPIAMDSREMSRAVAKRKQRHQRRRTMDSKEMVELQKARRAGGVPWSAVATGYY